MSTVFTRIESNPEYDFNIECWEWADEKLASSAFADFEATDCEYDAETGDHKYFDDDGACVAVTTDGQVIQRSTGFTW